MNVWLRLNIGLAVVGIVLLSLSQNWTAALWAGIALFNALSCRKLAIKYGEAA